MLQPEHPDCLINPRRGQIELVIPAGCRIQVGVNLPQLRACLKSQQLLSKNS